MARRSDVQQVVLDLLEEEALAIGGLVAVHDVEDDFVWRLFRSLDVIRGKALRRLGGQGSAEGAETFTNGPRLRPHPAIEEFLARLRRG